MLKLLMSMGSIQCLMSGVSASFQASQKGSCRSCVQTVSCLQPCTSHQKAGVQVLFEDRQPPCCVANATPAAIEVGLFWPARDKLGELQLGKPLHTVVVQADTHAGLAADQHAAEGKFMTLMFSQTGR